LIEAAIFDMDGLLVDSEPIWHHVEIDVFGRHGVPLTVERCLETKGMYLGDAVEHWYARYPWGGASRDEVATEITEAMARRLEADVELKPGAVHALDSLRALRPPRADSIYNGADDDGSGTVSLLEIAEAMTAAPQKPKRSIIFISHTAEEEGLYGSAWFTDHPTVPIDSLVTELDMDMVGRGSPADVEHGGPTYLELIGTRRLSTELGDVAERVDATEPLPFNFNYAFDAPGDKEEYYCRADHYSYARYGIPSINFSRGDHPDYHQVTDEPQYIDYDAMARVATYVRDLAFTIANLDHRVVVDKPKQQDPHAECVQ